MSNQKPKTGFALGVMLGAILGTSALHFTQTKSAKKNKQKLTKQIKEGLETLKEKYPQQAQQVEDIIHQALNEARQATQEITNLSSSSSKIPESKSTSTTKSKPERRFFSKSGKSLESPS